MSTLHSDRLKRNITIASFLVLSVLITAPQAISQPCAVSPVSAGVTVLPNVLMLVDNSGSMLYAAYPDAYNDSTTYYGLFDPTKSYNYNSSNDYFEEDTGGSWSGNFLNWAAIVRWDVAIYVLTGQRYEDVGSDRFLVSNPDNRYYHDSFDDRAWYDDTDNVTDYASGTARRYRPVPCYYSGSLTDNRWSYLEVHYGSNYDYYYLRIKVASDYEPEGLVHTLEDEVRLGIIHFNGSEGGYIQRYINDLDSTELSSLIDDLHRPLVDDTSSFSNYIYTTWTPLAETLYEATRYFRQVSPYYSSGDYTVADASHHERDPFYYYDDEWVKLRCPKNYVVIVTDGEATQDRNIPVNDDASRPLRDADNDGCDSLPCPGGVAGCGYESFNCNAYPFSCADPSWDNCGSAYLDDVAFYAANNDLRSDLTEDQSITTHTVFVFGASDGPGAVLLDKTAVNGGGEYHLATDATALADALEDIFLTITQDAAAAASTAITSEPVEGIDMIYVPYYKNPQEYQWLGNIRAFRLDSSSGYLLEGSTGTTEATDSDGDLVLDAPKWDVSVELKVKADADSRTIFTYISPSSIEFDTSNAATLGPYFDVDLDNDTTEDEVGTDQEVNALIAYIRGNDTPSGFSGLRERDPDYLGDIMHASPIFVGKPSARYGVIYGDLDYWDFYWDNINRTPVLYAPANDGMIHCFDADDGEEHWAYIPYNLLPHLKWLTDPSYCHCYYVDLTANVWDIEVGGAWKSVLVGGMRLGGTPDGVDTDNDGIDGDETLRSAMFALDVTDPTTPSVLWEINDGTDERFGYTTSRPVPVRVADAGTTEWFLVFGSGPKTRDGEGADNSDGYDDFNGYIFVVDPDDGSIARRIELGSSGVNNFFGPPVAIDYDTDYKVDLIYIGDAKGNLWRIKTFVVSGGVKTYYTTPADWSIDVNSDDETNPEPLLSLGTDQPILVKPSVSMDTKGRVWIFLGTGRYFCSDDNRYCGEGNVCPDGTGSCTVTDGGSGVGGMVYTRSKYMTVGVYDRHWDSSSTAFVLQDSTLNFATLDHRVIMTGQVVGTGATGYYVVDADTGQMEKNVSTNGWYYHLLDERERCLGDFTLYDGTVYYLTFTPDISDPCVRGGLSSMYGVYYASGTSTEKVVMDITGEGAVDDNDLIEDASDNRYGGAILKLPKGFAGGGVKIKAFSDVVKAYPPLPDNPPITISGEGGGPGTGVTSWREVLQ